MAVIITNTGCTLSQANAFWRVESHNLSFIGSTTTYGVSIASSQYIPLTFNDVGIFQGVVLNLFSNDTAPCTYSALVELQQSRTCLMPVASPGVVTLVGHGFSNGQQVQFTTSGTLPTGIVSNTIYYARNSDCVTPLNEFWVYSTQAYAIAGGTTGRINFTGVPSGTHTCHDLKADKTLTALSINGRTYGSSYYRTMGYHTIDFRGFSSSITINTAASGWRFRVARSGTGAGTWYLARGRDNVTFSYAAYCDTLLSFTNGDTLIVADYCDIDQSATFAGVLGMGDTIAGTAIVICSNQTDITTDNVSYLRCLDPVSGYTLTINGLVLINSHAGFRAGTSASPIPLDKKLTIIFGLVVGTSKIGFICSYSAYSTSYYSGCKSSLFLYGESVSQLRTTLSEQALVGDNHIHTTDDMSAIWNIGDIIAIGKQNVIGQGSLIYHTISSFSGTQINLTPNIASYARYNGASVINITEANYSISLKSDNTTAVATSLLSFNNLNIEGVYNYYHSFSQSLGIYYYSDDDDDVIIKSTCKNCCAAVTTDVNLVVLGVSFINRKGFDIDKLVGHRVQMVYYPMGGGNTTYFISGDVTINDICVLSPYNYGFGFSTTYTGCLITITNVYLDNNRAATYCLCISGINIICKNIYLWGVGSSITYPALYFNGANNYFENVHIDGCTVAIGTLSTSIVQSNIFKDVYIDVEKASTSDYSLPSSSSINTLFKNTTGFITPYDANQQAKWTAGSYLVFKDKEGIANNDMVMRRGGNIQRCGDGLTDTTVHTTGTGKFSVRYESIWQTYSQSTDVRKWVYLEMPLITGNCNGKQITLKIWIKINSANYYSGTYSKPRIRIIYDNDVTEVYAEAINDTNWQQVTLSFTPATNANKIKVYLETRTDQTGTNSYVYFDDMEFILPYNQFSNFGGLDLWYDGEPVLSATINTNQVALGSAGETLIEISNQNDTTKIYKRI